MKKYIMLAILAFAHISTFANQSTKDEELAVAAANLNTHRFIELIQAGANPHAIVTIKHTNKNGKFKSVTGNALAHARMGNVNINTSNKKTRLSPNGFYKCVYDLIINRSRL